MRRSIQARGPTTLLPRSVPSSGLATATLRLISAISANTRGAGGHRLRVHRMRYPLPRRATLPRLQAILQTGWSRSSVPALRRAGCGRRSHRMTTEVCPLQFSTDLFLSTKKGSPAPLPKKNYYGGVSLPDPEIIPTGGPYLSIEVGRSPLSKPRGTTRSASRRSVSESRTAKLKY